MFDYPILVMPIIKDNDMPRLGLLRQMDLSDIRSVSLINVDKRNLMADFVRKEGVIQKFGDEKFAVIVEDRDREAYILIKDKGASYEWVLSKIQPLVHNHQRVVQTAIEVTGGSY